MQNTIDVLALLRNQHQEIDQLIERLQNVRRDRVALFDELADKLAAHTTVEEKIFYPAAMSKRTDAMLHEAVEEHLALRRILADMLELDPESEHEAFDAKLAVLKEEVEHHAHEEEERKLFPILREAMTAQERAALGNEALAMFEELLPHHPCETLREQTDEAAPLPSP